MTPQEEQLLNGLIQRVQQTQLSEKDNEAETLLAQTLGRNPDALYILSQTVLVQQYALDQAQKQLAASKETIEDLQDQVRAASAPPERHTSFLGGLFGSNEDSATTEHLPAAGTARPPAGGMQPSSGYASVQPTQSGWQQVPVQPGYGAPQGYPPPPPPPGYGYGGPQYAPSSGPFGMGGGGFLQSAMTTAAGVVAGEMAFRGIEDLMHGFGEHAGYERGFEGQPEVVNNYYGDSDAKGGDSFGDRLQKADGDSNALSPDIEDRRDDGGRGFFGGDAGSGGDQFVDSSTDDSAQDDSNFGDDSGSFDDGGSFDDNSNDNSGF